MESTWQDSGRQRGGNRGTAGAKAERQEREIQVLPLGFRRIWALHLYVRWPLHFSERCCFLPSCGGCRIPVGPTGTLPAQRLLERRGEAPETFVAK